MREYLLVLLVALSTTFLVAGLCRRIAIRVGALAKVRERDVHSRPTPYLGGVAMLAGVFAAFLLASQLPFLGRHPVVSQDARGIFLAAAVICLVGALDDALELSAIVKAAGQVLAAAVAVINGVRMYWIPLPNSIIALDQATSILVTVIFIVACVNAINFVDGLDGLAAGVVAIGSFAFFTYTYVLAYQQHLVVATTASLVTVTISGICLGFLPHNFYRARMFMGDSGAMLLGLLLALSTIAFTGQMDSSVLQPDGGSLLPALLPIVLPFAIMALPLIDLVWAYVRRTVRGSWWFHADRQHLHHRLMDRGHSQVSAVFVMYLWTAVIAFGTIAIGLEPGWLTGGLFLVALCIVGVFTAAPWRKPAKVTVQAPQG